MAQTNVLTNEQKAACNAAIHAFIAKATATYGRGSVILLPEFNEQPDGSWLPVQGNGIRPTSNNSAFMRFGKMTINQSTGKPQYIFTNHFGDSEDELKNMVAFIDPLAVTGSAVRGIRLVIHESLTPFSRTNPSRDIKWADQKEGLACLKNVVDPDSGEVTQANIYRRTKVFFADDEGNYPDTAKNILIAHDNASALSEAAFQKWSAANKANSGMGNATQKAARLAELQGIPANKRTKEQKAELAELL